MANNIFTFQKNVTTSGTPVQLNDQTVDTDQTVLIKAKPGNTGTIYLGNSSTNALNSNTAHVKLAPGQAVKLQVKNTNQLWIDASVSGEGVEVLVGADEFSAGDNVNLRSALAGEDLTNDVMKTEQRFTGSGVLTSDTAVKTGAGFVHSVTISQNDAAPTAGTIDIYDNTAGSGTKLFTWTLTTAVFTPFTIILDQSFSNGLYVDFTTVADVAVSVSYR
jgi:hypothetical protein